MRFICPNRDTLGCTKNMLCLKDIQDHLKNCEKECELCNSKYLGVKEEEHFLSCPKQFEIKARFDEICREEITQLESFQQ